MIKNLLLSCHLCGYLFDVLLSLDVYPGDSGQIDDGKIGTIVGIDPQFDGIIDDLSALSRYFVGYLLYVGPHFSKISIFLSSSVVFEYSIWLSLSFPWIILEVLGSMCTNLSSRGLRVTTPDPLGKKSRPTMFSSSELLPLDWVPKTAILGREISLSRP